MKNLKSKPRSFYFQLFFILSGIASTIWFLIRVIPKLSRATYPCQRAAFPIMSGFVIWFHGLLLSIFCFKKAKHLFRQQKFVFASILFAFFALSALTLYYTQPVEELIASVQPEVIPTLKTNYSFNSTNSIIPEATVSIVKSDKENVGNITKDEIETMVNQAIELAGGLDDIIMDGDVVVLKPNIVSLTFNGDYTTIPDELSGMVTDWRVVAAVAKVVRAVNPNGSILLMEGTVGSTSDAYTYLHYNKTNIPELDELLAFESISGDWQEFDAPELSQVTLPAGKTLYTGHPNNTLYLNKRYYEADVIISLPVLKNHETAGVTGAIKNLAIGCTPANIYAGSEGNTLRGSISHFRSDLHKFLHDYYMAKPADFALMDGLQGFNDGPVGKVTPNINQCQENMRVILASKDPVAMDAIESLIMGDDPSMLEYLVYLNNDDLGCSAPLAIKVLGTQVGEIKKDFPHENPNATRDDYEDFIAPTASLDTIITKDNLMTISLDVDATVTKVDVEIAGESVPQIFTSGFDNIEIDVTGISQDLKEVKIYVQDEYLNLTTIIGDGTVVPTEPKNPTVAIENISANKGISIFPNPVNSILNIKLDKPGVYEISIYGLDGKKIIQTNTSQSEQLKIDCSSLKSGMYYGRMKSKNEVRSFKFLKQ